MTPIITYPPHRRGTRFFDTITITDEAGVALPVTGWAFSCRGRAYTGATTVLCEAEVVIVDGPNGQISVDLDSAATLDAALDHVPTVEFSLLSIDTAGNELEEAILVLPLKDVI